MPGCQRPAKEVPEPGPEGAREVEAEEGADSAIGVGQESAEAGGHVSHPFLGVCCPSLLTVQPSLGLGAQTFAALF